MHTVLPRALTFFLPFAMCSIVYIIENFGFCSNRPHYHTAEVSTASMHADISSMHFSILAPVPKELVQYFER